MPAMTTAKKWFHEKLEANNFSVRKLARSMNLDPSAVSRILSGQRRLTIDEATLLSRLLSTPIEEILTAAGARMPMSNLKSNQTLTIGGWIDSEGKVHWGRPKNGSAPLPAFAAKDIKVVRFQTAGSGGVYESMDGALAYFRPRESGSGVDSETIGRLALAEDANGANWVAVIRRGYGPGLFNLVAMSGALVAEGVQLKSGTPIVWLKM